MSIRYTVSGFDVCMQGFERLRSQSEFLLVAYVTPSTTREELLQQFLDDIQACERSDGFDYDAAREAVRAYMADLNMARALQCVEDPGDDDDAETCSAFLYVTDNAAE